MKAPCKDGYHHTEYGLFRGEGDTVFPFPEVNFWLTTDEHQEWVRAELAKKGLRLVVHQGRGSGGDRADPP